MPIYIDIRRREPPFYIDIYRPTFAFRRKKQLLVGCFLLMCYLYGVRTSKTAYKSLRHTIEMMSRQIADSIEFANDFLPKRTTCQEIWYILKDNLIYRNDPPGVELLQSFPSLMEDNYWGIPGAGDCDCFTIAALACAKARGIPARAVIVGNSIQAPTHIYAQLFDGSKFIDFDLVSSSYGTTKAYKNKQIIKLH